MLLENSVNRLARCRVDTWLQFVKNTISVKHNKAKCKIIRYACTYFPDVHTSQVAVLVVKNPPVNARDIRDEGSIPGWGRSSGRGHGNSLYCLGNPVGRGAWQVAVHGVAKSWAWLRDLECRHLPEHTFLIEFHAFVLEAKNFITVI